MEISKLICELLNIDFINFSLSENFVKLLDLIFRLKRFFNLHMRRRIKNFVEDTLCVFYEELQEAKYEAPLQVKELIEMISKEKWNV